MRRRSRIVRGIITLVIILAVSSFFFLKWSRAHVNYITATEDHPLDCFACHLYIQKDNIFARLVNREYLSPYKLAVSKAGDRLYVVAQESNSVLVVDLAGNKVLNKIRVGNHPHTIALDKTGKYGYVSNEWADNVYVIDLEVSKVTDTLKTGNGPAGMALSADGKYLYVVNSFSNNVSVFDLGTREEIRRIDAGNNPSGIIVSPDGRTVYVTSRRGQIAPYGTPLETEMTIIDADLMRVTEHKNIESAYLMENAAFTPSGDLAITPLIRPKNLVPTIQVERGWMMTEGIGIVEQKPGGRTIQLLLDEPNAYYSDPFDIAITPDGKKAFITNAGVDIVSVINIDSLRSLIAGLSPAMAGTCANNLGLSSRFVMKRIPTGPNPKGMAMSPDGKKLYVAEMLNDRIKVISTENLEAINDIDLGGPRKITVLRHGRRLLNSSGGTFQKQYSCYTCHPDVHEDGLVYNMAAKDMGRNMTNTQSLRNIGDTPPFKWNGKNQTIYKQDGMRFSTVLTRTEAYSYKDLDALVAYIMAGVPNPPDLAYNPKGELTPAQLRGKKIFERTRDTKGNEIPPNGRCITCHPAPYYTNKLLEDVGTLAATDDSIKFDTPFLNNIWSSPPYLHDGRASTLEEIWTVYGRNEKHGKVNDLSKIQLNDLIEYLKSLRDPEYENANLKSGKHKL
ncbi:MAG: beta-propeller fold lactonase family protein [Bacteroidales bacterium]|jgi:YVTN family beta-propeller protein